MPVRPRTLPAYRLNNRGRHHRRLPDDSSSVGWYRALLCLPKTPHTLKSHHIFFELYGREYSY